MVEVEGGVSTVGREKRGGSRLGRLGRLPTNVGWLGGPVGTEANEKFMRGKVRKNGRKMVGKERSHA